MIADLTTRLRTMALQVIGTADRMLAAVQRGDVAPMGIADPEPWTIKRANARRILEAIDSGRRVERQWFFAIGRTRASDSSRAR